MEREFLTWGNVIVWAVCSILLYLSLNFRLYMIRHHPMRRLRERLSRRKSKESGKMPPRPMRKVLDH